MTSHRPLKPVGYLFVPLAFLLTRARPVFDYFWPEKTKYKYRVADSSKDAEPVAEPLLAEQRPETKAKE